MASPRSLAHLRLAALAVALVLVASACGGASESSGGEQGRQTLAELGLSADQGESGLAEAGEPVRGGDLSYGVGPDTDSYCLPEAQLATAGMTIARAIYDTLLTVSESGEPSPYLAESFEPNNTYDVWTMVLRDGITFHDGSDLTAEVVKNNLDAYRGQYEGRNSLLLSFTLADISDVRVVDDLTLEIETSRPWVALPTYLTSPRISIMAQAQLDDADACDRNMIGTGPFVLDQWEPSNFLRATRNADYWQIAPDGEPYPYVDSIEFRFIVDGQIRAQSLEGGDLDLLQTANAADIGGRHKDLVDEGGANIFVSNVGAEVDFVQLNHTVPPFDDPRVREALAMAVDREALNDVIADGHHELATGPYAPDSIGHVDDAGFPAYDPEGARQLVDEYVADGGDASFTLVHTTDPTVARTAELIQQDAIEAGFSVDLAQRDQAALINDAIGKGYQAMLFRNFAGGDPDNTYVWWYGQDNPVNFAGFDDPEINDLLDEGRSETDPDRRPEIYQDIDRQMSGDVHGLWLWPTDWAIVTGPDVHGIRGPELPDGAGPTLQLTYGHPLLGLWKSS